MVTAVEEIIPVTIQRPNLLTKYQSRLSGSEHRRTRVSRSGCDACESTHHLLFSQSMHARVIMQAPESYPATRLFYDFTSLQTIHTQP